MMIYSYTDFSKTLLLYSIQKVDSHFHNIYFIFITYYTESNFQVMTIVKEFQQLFKIPRECFDDIDIPAQSFINNLSNEESKKKIISKYNEFQWNSLKEIILYAAITNHYWKFLEKVVECFKSTVLQYM